MMTHRKPRKLTKRRVFAARIALPILPTPRDLVQHASQRVARGVADAGTGINSEKRISLYSLTIGLHWPIAPHSPQTIEQGRWFQQVGEIFINKGQTNRSILREQKRCWHRQLP